MIVLKDLVVEYSGGIVALRGISIEVPSDRVVCILGPNGSGKSSLLRAISRLVNFEGTIFLDGISISREPLKTISRLVSYASQISVSELISLSVREVLLISRYPLVRGFFESREDLEAVESAARELIIQELLDRKLHELSSGELQRVVLAAAIVKEPKYLLFDELDAHVDVGVKRALASLVERWRERSTVIFTTHDMLFGSLVGEYFVVLDRGSVVFTGTRDELINNKRVLEEVYGVEVLVVDRSSRKFLLPIYV